MKDFEKAIPFDPGFSKISFSFVENVQLLENDWEKLKVNHQKKFWLIKFEPTIIDFINNSSCFYLGCILWGGLIKSRFKSEPKEIFGNTTDTLSEEELKDLDCAAESKLILQYIEKINRDYKFFLKRQSKISGIILEILNSYVEFAQINNNFVGIKYTSDINLPKSMEHFEKLSVEQLDSLSEKIFTSINTNQIQDLLKIGFYKV